MGCGSSVSSSSGDQEQPWVGQTPVSSTRTLQWGQRAEEPMGRAHPCLPAGLPRAARSPHSRPVPRTAILGQLPALAAHALPRSPTSENGWRPTGSGRVAPACGGFILLLLYSWRRGFCSEALRDFYGKQRGGCSLGPLHRQEVFNRYLSPWLYGNCRLRVHISRMFSFKGNFCRHRLCYIACPLFDPQ